MRLRRVGEGVGYFAPPVDREVQLLEIEEIPFPKLWMEIKIRYPTFAHETAGVLQLSGPDRTVGPSPVERRPICRIKREYWLTIAVSESFDPVRLSVPLRIR